ncbi:MAG: hypothetical protein JXR70_00160 [Spirochaetales bacterium]|nr:hypothetical protein [Spirochaetales bacterium]
MSNDEDNRLVIPKNAKQELVFHYDRKERLSMQGAPSQKKTEGFIKKYRGLLIILADIVIIGLIFLGTQIMFSYNGRPINQYSFELSGYRISDKVFASLRIISSEQAAIQNRAKRVSIDFFLEGYGRKYTLENELPQDAGQHTEIRGTLVSPLKDLVLTAHIFIGNERRELSVKVRER